MTENKQRLTTIEGIEKVIDKRVEANSNYLDHLNHNYKKMISGLYDKAVWIDANIPNSCAVDPYFGFHFYDEEDAMAFKLRWTDVE